MIEAVSGLTRDFRSNLKNLVGWNTRRKIVVFEVDDYGNIRVASREARDRMISSGLNLSTNVFDRYDALEDQGDLTGLYEVLTSAKDKHGRHAVFTVFSVPANPDFEKIKKENYSAYYYELLPEVFKKLPGYEHVWVLWREGIERKILCPQFHGREHLNVKSFMESLRQGHEQTLRSFENRSYCGITKPFYPTIGYTEAFSFYRYGENEILREIIVDGLNIFEKVFGFRAKCFCAPGRPAHCFLEKTLVECGIRFISAPIIKKEHQGGGRYRKIWNYLGKKGPLGQIYTVRNCEFSPMINSKVQWVDRCLRQVESAFRWHKPAIISSHRVNFGGHIDPAVRDNGLKLLRDLLARIVKKWPEVEFMTSVELGELIGSRSGSS